MAPSSLAWVSLLLYLHRYKSTNLSTMHTQVRVHAIVQIMLYDAHLPSDFLKVLDHFVLLCVSVIFRFQLKNLRLWLTRLVIRTGCRYIFVCPLFYSVLLQNVHLDTTFEMHIQVTSVCLIQSMLKQFIGNLYLSIS